MHRLHPQSLVASTPPPGAHPDGPQIVSPHTTETLLQIMRANVTGGSGKSANVPGLNVGGKTGTGDKWDAAARRYSTTKQVSSFAAVFPTDGPVFVGLVIGVILIVGGLTFFPALALGPLVEHLSMNAGTLF